MLEKCPGAQLRYLIANRSWTVIAVLLPPFRSYMRLPMARARRHRRHVRVQIPPASLPEFWPSPTYSAVPWRRNQQGHGELAKMPSHEPSRSQKRSRTRVWGFFVASRPGATAGSLTLGTLISMLPQAQMRDLAVMIISSAP